MIEQSFIVTVRTESWPFTVADVRHAFDVTFPRLQEAGSMEVQIAPAPSAPVEVPEGKPLTVADVLRWPLDPNGPNY